MEEEQILDALSTIQDPDLGKDIVTLGFVRNIQICGGQVGFDINLTTPACPVKDKMKKEAEEKVGRLDGVETVNVTMTSETVGDSRDGQPTPDQDGEGGRQEFHALDSVKNIVAVASGKGGVGKSTVAANLALSLAKDGAEVGLMDADVYGPSIPTMFGIKDERPKINEDKQVIPLKKHGIHLISIGVLQNQAPDTPTIWRGPIATNMIKQFLGGVVWSDLDYLIIDMPPGTGDIQLTLTQAAPLTGGVIVTTPQNVSLIDARKGLKMFEKVNVPILGLVENMSQFVCPDCESTHYIFRKGGAEEVAEELDAPMLGEIPIDPQVTVDLDEGQPFLEESPDSPAAEAFVDFSRSVAARLSTLHLKEESDRQEFSIEWEA